MTEISFKYDDPTTKTLSPQTRKDLAAQLKNDVDEFCVKEFTSEHREHLGASIIGHDCDRYIWSVYRWLKFQIFDGRMLRLFQRGHEEEKRFITWLRAIGCQVWEVDPNTGKQFRIWGVKGHYGGSADSVGITKYFPDLPMLMEYKTHNTKSFVALQNKGVVLYKPQHFSQMSSYGRYYGFKYGLYVAVNKNDDDLYFEILELNWNLGHNLANKAQDIIEAKFPPAKISEQPSYYECKYCPFQGPCHHGEAVDKNCRSCKFSTPVDNAEWYCNRFNSIIPKEYIIKGCDGHVSINI